MSEQPVFPPNASRPNVAAQRRSGAAAPQRWSPAGAVVGGVMIAVAASSVLDDSGLVPHPWWVVPVVCAFLASVAVAAMSLRSVLRSG